MTTVTSTFPTLAHIMASIGPDGMEARVANVLSRKLPILDYLPWQEGNLATGHQITQSVNSLPSGAWRRLNEGVPYTVTETAHYVESCGILEDNSKIDEVMLEMNGGAAYRAIEDQLKLEAFRQQFMTALIYESVSTNPSRIHGLTPRYPATTGYTSSSYVLAGTNAGVNARSIWLVTFAPRKIYGIYPKGTKAGLESIDRGLVKNTDSVGTLWCYETTHRWRCGLAVEDYRYAVRFQWDPDDSAMDASEKSLYLKMQDMLSTIYEVGEGTVFMMDRTSKMRLDAQLASNTVNFLEYVERGGKRIPMFQGVPILVDDSFAAETAIS